MRHEPPVGFDTAHHHVFVCPTDDGLAAMRAHIAELERDRYRVVAMATVADSELCVTMFRP